MAAFNARGATVRSISRSVSSATGCSISIARPAPRRCAAGRTSLLPPRGRSRIPFIVTSTSARPPAVALFAATALAIGVTVGFGLGLWLLWARVFGLGLFGASWAVLVQVHGLLQLFGFAGVFAVGVGLHAIPRFRGARPVPPVLVGSAYAGVVGGIVLRAIAQPLPDLPGRMSILAIAGALLVGGAIAFAYSAVRALVEGRNPHRPDELLIGAGCWALPVAAVLVALEMTGAAPPLVDQAADDRAIWAMLLGFLGTLVFGVWARLAPGFVAAMPARPRPVLVGAGIWLGGTVALVLGLPFAPWVLLGGLALLTWGLEVFGPGIARQPLPRHAWLTRLGVRSAFGWAFVGIAILAAGAIGPEPSYLQISAARHALALGFITVTIYSVGARALPAFLGRRLWSHRLQVATLLAAELGVALRVVPQAVRSTGSASDAIVGLSGALAYVALVLFAVNVGRTLRGPSDRPIAPGAPVPLELHIRR